MGSIGEFSGRGGGNWYFSAAGCDPGIELGSEMPMAGRMKTGDRLPYMEIVNIA